jgi:hypothetical protein
MEKNRGTAIAVIVALVVSVISLGVAFATFSTTLNINGSATVQATKWDVHFANAAYDANGTNTASTTAVQITPSTPAGGTVTNATGQIGANGQDFTWSATFKSPGDYVEYTFYVVNAGDYNAALSGTFASAPTCEGVISEIQTTCPITYSISDGSAEYSSSVTLPAHSSKVVKVRATLNDNYGGTDGTSLYRENQTATFGQVIFTWTQSGSAQ